ncbi:MAG: 6-phosphofructokinase [Candidatus Marinimicrobia bacterium]|nr:6-phosphofructokinase [Candidatus Neomarinimicrobiota bacterium]
MKTNKIKRIGVLTSGGDSPGMNAAIRAVVRGAIYNKVKVYGIQRGYQGLVDNDMQEMHSHSVSNIIQIGGTILKTARCMDFMTAEGRRKAYENLVTRGIDALVTIGGDGTFAGAQELGEEFNFPIVGIPGTIDNDICGTDYTIGYDTALNTVVEAVDKIRDTASAHNRLFFIEVMGRNAGFLTLHGGIATGAEAIMVPEYTNDFDMLNIFLNSAQKQHKTSSIVLVAEGDELGGAIKLAKKVEKDHPEYDVRVTILGHIQRGGSPSAIDRVNAGRMGVSAVEALLEGKKDMMVGLMNGKIVYSPFSRSKKEKRPLDPHLMDLIRILSI